MRQQAGVISRPQALAVGLSEDQVDRRVASGRWFAVHPRVYLGAGHDFSDKARVLAAGLWAGDRGTVSGLAAAWWHGLHPEAPSMVEITLPRGSGLRGRTGIRLRRRPIADMDRVWVRGLWVTAVPLTVLEAAANLGERGAQLVDHALQRRVGFDALHRAHCRNLGRWGAAEAARLLVMAADRAASAAERKAITLLRRANLTGWRRHYLLHGYELDLAFPGSRLAIELDGWAWHHDAHTFRRDRRRQNALVLAGWTVLRFTWDDLTLRPHEVIAEILAAIDAAAEPSAV